MPRPRGVLVLVFLLLLVAAEPVLAQGIARFPTTPFARGPGFYLQWVKLAVTWVMFIVWVSSATWVNADAQRTRNDVNRWNLIMFVPFALAFMLLFFIPWFWLSYPLLFLTWLIPTILYVRMRNSQLPPHLKVMTSDHLRFLLAERLNAVGIKMRLERQSLDSMGPEIDLVPMGGATDRDNTANLLLARQLPAFVPAKEMLSDSLESRASSILMDFTQDAVDVRYQIDGVWHPSDPRDREMGDGLLAVMKHLAALKPAERRARQSGKFRTERGKQKLTWRITSQGTKTGERAIITYSDGKLQFPKLGALGMPDRLQEKLVEVLGQTTGIVVVSAPPQGGLTTTFDSLLNSIDRFTRNFIAIEDVRGEERQIENVAHQTYDSAAGESPIMILDKVARMYPDVLVCRNLPNAETVVGLCEQMEENRLVITSIRAKETAEALLRIMMLKVPAATLAPAVTAVTAQRLVRKLCEKCKEAYPPPPQILKSMGIPAGKVEAFYRPPQDRPENEEPCSECSGIGYKGRTAFFEVMVVDDGVREALAKAPKLDVVRTQARKAGMRTLQEEGLLLVVKGVTSLAELTRVLKE